tara:strand:- start:1367 stop:1657 length:291 start_codon:yes stop_codon:yes gene_type:complete
MDLYTSFRADFKNKVFENNCLSERIEYGLCSNDDGVLASILGEYIMEPFLKHMSSIEFLEIFAPKLLTKIIKRNDEFLEYDSLFDLYDDIEFYETF